MIQKFSLNVRWAKWVSLTIVQRSPLAKNHITYYQKLLGSKLSWNHLSSSAYHPQDLSDLYPNLALIFNMEQSKTPRSAPFSKCLLNLQTSLTKESDWVMSSGLPAWLPASASLDSWILFGEKGSTPLCFLL